jgi:putative spermidine/putrescine transport system permease protein
MRGASSRSNAAIARVSLWIFCTLVFVFLLAPILAIIPLSFSSGSFLTYPVPGWSTKWYASLIESDKWIRAFANSMIVGIAATAIATILGTLASLGLARNQSRSASAFNTLAIAPMIVPDVLIAVSLYFFLAPLKLTNSFAGLIIAHTVIAVPFVVITVSATLEQVDSNLARAAASLGANAWTTFFRVTLPSIFPGVAAGALFAFAISFDDVVLTLFIGGVEQRTLPRELFSGLRDRMEPSMMAVATLMIVLSTTLFLTVAWLKRRAVARNSSSS